MKEALGRVPFRFPDPISRCQNSPRSQSKKLNITHSLEEELKYLGNITRDSPPASIAAAAVAACCQPFGRKRWQTLWCRGRGVSRLLRLLRRVREAFGATKKRVSTPEIQTRQVVLSGDAPRSRIYMSTYQYVGDPK